MANQLHVPAGSNRRDNQRVESMGERATGSLSPCHYSTALFSTGVLWTIMMKQQMVKQLHSASSCTRVWLPAFTDTQVSGGLSRKKILAIHVQQGHPSTHPSISSHPKEISNEYTIIVKMGVTA